MELLEGSTSKAEAELLLLRTEQPPLSQGSSQAAARRHLDPITLRDPILVRSVSSYTHQTSTM